MNWYLTGDEAHNPDGRHVTYLDAGNRLGHLLRQCDPDLYARLSSVVLTGRSVANLEAALVLPPGSLTCPRLRPRMSISDRRAWHCNALDHLLDADVVFVDPDNGLRARWRSDKAEKFVYADEIASYTDRGQAVVVYHHADRSAPVAE